MKPITPETAQARINEVQQLYREWTQLFPRLQAAQQEWQRGAEIMHALSQFYFDGEFGRYHDALENGLHPPLSSRLSPAVRSNRR